MRFSFVKIFLLRISILCYFSYGQNIKRNYESSDIVTSSIFNSKTVTESLTTSDGKQTTKNKEYNKEYKKNKNQIVFKMIEDFGFDRFRYLKKSGKPYNKLGLTKSNSQTEQTDYTEPEYLKMRKKRDQMSTTDINDSESVKSKTTSSYQNGIPKRANKKSSKSEKNPCKRVIKKYSSEEKYRRLDGSYNNLDRPEWGTAMSFYKRMTRPVYGDGISSPRLSHSKSELPNARYVTSKLFSIGQKTDQYRSLLTMQWAQFVAHDMSQFAKTDIDCCSFNNETYSEKLCYPIIFPNDDEFVLQSGINCQDYTRTLTDAIYGCNNDSSPARQVNAVTAYLDLSNVYGNDKKTCKSLRSMKGGQLLAQQTDETILPPIEENLDLCFCNKPGENLCFKTGDTRSNESPHLAIVHMVLLREHNRIAQKLQQINPHWNDSTLFQEARKINIAQYQHIVYYELLPELLGWKNLANAGIIFPNAKGYVNDYDSGIQPAIINEFATAAFRHFISQTPGLLQLMTSYTTTIGVEPINKWINRPQILNNINKLEQLTIGLMAQRCEMNDNIYAKELINKVQKCRGKRFIKDLKSMDVQRDRDHGLAYYNEYRQLCGLGAAHSFEEYQDFIPKASVDILRELYESHEDVDLSVGGVLEMNWNGAQVGPTFLCIILQQFKHTRLSDRFFYEHESARFTKEQLNEIRKSSISRVFCDSADAIFDVQSNGFSSVPEESILPCEVLPQLNLDKWKSD